MIAIKSIMYDTIQYTIIRDGTVRRDTTQDFPHAGSHLSASSQDEAATWRAPRKPKSAAAPRQGPLRKSGVDRKVGEYEIAR